MEPTFKISSYCDNGGCVAVAALPAGFRTSSHSEPQHCVDVSPAGNNAVAVRDSKQKRLPEPERTTHFYSEVAWWELINLIKAGRFDAHVMLAERRDKKTVVAGEIGLGVEHDDMFVLSCECTGCGCPPLRYTENEWQTFIRGVKADEFDIDVLCEPAT
jgi:hypothetical protein